MLVTGETTEASRLANADFRGATLSWVMGQGRHDGDELSGHDISTIRFTIGLRGAHNWQVGRQSEPLYLVWG